MSYNQYSVRGNYLRGVNDLIGKGMADTRMKNIVLRTDINAANNMPQVYYLLTRDLIEKMSSSECKLSDNIKRALSCAIGIKLWDDFSGVYFADKSILPENYVQRFVGETLMNNIGERETAIMALKDPDLFGDFLDSIPFNNESFLSYFSRELDLADGEQKVTGGVTRSIGDFSHALDCISAVFTCSDRLRLPRQRMDKVVERAKQKRKTNEREHR